MSSSATFGGVFLGLCLSVSAAAQSLYPFQFQVPDGWRRVSGDYPDPSNLPADAINSSEGIPRDYIREAMSGTYQFYAVDPKGDRPSTVGAIATGAVVQTTGRINQETLEQYISGLAAATPAGMRIRINEARLVKLNGVDVGMFSGSVEGPDGSLSTLQYLIPGKTLSAILTYKCPPKDYERYRPVFESAAMATVGAYDHTPKMDWGRTLFVGLMGGGLALGRLLFIRLFRPKADAAPQATASPQAAAALPAAATSASSSGVWECPSCHRRVPARVPQCRCGAARPA